MKTEKTPEEVKMERMEEAVEFIENAMNVLKDTGWDVLIVKLKQDVLALQDEIHYMLGG